MKHLLKCDPTVPVQEVKYYKAIRTWRAGMQMAAADSSPRVARKIKSLFSPRTTNCYLFSGVLILRSIRAGRIKKKYRK